MTVEGFIGGVIFVGVILALVMGREYIRKRAASDRAAREAPQRDAAE